jgi:cytochrome c biogenesis protein CcdA
MSPSLNVLLFSAAVLGFRHGFDYDHIAAISDIGGMQAHPSKTMRLGLMYALGHAATVALLGGLVIGFQLTLPKGMDRWAERFVGLTLVVLAIYVLSTLARRREMPKSRSALLIGAVRWMQRRLQTWRTGHHHPAVSNAPEVTGTSCFGIGVIHGFGAETPSQLALFLLAANLGGVSKGLMGLAVFLLGLLTMNTLMTASVAGFFTAGRRWTGWYPVITCLTAAYSLGIGIIFLFGRSDWLVNISGS